MSADPSTLHTAMSGFADLLEEAAAAVPWTRSDGTPVPAVVAPVEPAVDCDQMAVWVDRIETVHLRGCVAQPRVFLAYRIATCIGAAANETAAWWAERAEDALDRLWGVYGYLTASYLNGTLCDDLGGLSCDDVRFEPVTRQASGDYAVWDGGLRVDLPVVDAAS